MASRSENVAVVIDAFGFCGGFVRGVGCIRISGFVGVVFRGGLLGVDMSEPDTSVELVCWRQSLKTVMIWGSCKSCSL